MEIKKFELDRPDSDGDRSIDLEFEVTNTTAEDIFLIKYDAFYTNASGHLISSNVSANENCLLEEGDSETLTGWGRINERYLVADETPTVTVQARLFKREFFKLGSLDLQEDDGVKYFEAEVKSSLIGEKIKVSISRAAPDDDGDVRVEFQCMVLNTSDTYLESLELKAAIFDRKGSEIDYATASDGVSPHALINLDPSFWSLKLKKLKGATVEFSLSVFQQVALVSQQSSLKSGE